MRRRAVSRVSGGAAGWTHELAGPRCGRCFPCGWRSGSIPCQRKPTSRTLRLSGWCPTPWLRYASQPSQIGRSRGRSSRCRGWDWLRHRCFFRDSLSSFFAWAVRERMIPINPVTPTRVPKSSTPRTEMYPFSEEELEELYGRAAERDQRLADLLLVDAWTTTNLYLHHLGTAADRAGLDRLNRRGHTGGTRSVLESE